MEMDKQYLSLTLYIIKHDDHCVLLRSKMTVKVSG